MKAHRLFRLLSIAIVLLVGCNPIYVDHDWDEDADFTRYQTYTWLEVPLPEPTNAAQAKQQSPLVAKRIHADINNELKAKGLHEVEEDGDLVVVYYLGAKHMLEVQQNTYSRMDVWADYAVGGALNTTEVTEGRIIIDLIDGGTKKLVWRGQAENTSREDATQQQRNETIDKAIEKVFRKYPPK